MVAGNFIGTDVTGTHCPGHRWLRATALPSRRGAFEQLDRGQPDRRDGRCRRGECRSPATLRIVGVQSSGTGRIGNVVAGNRSAPTSPGPGPRQLSGGVEIDVARPAIRSAESPPIAGNLITDNGGPGVVVGYHAGDLCIGNQITANRIFANTGQAIDLGDDGVTDNATSPRQGPNNLQNFPIVVTTADGQLQGWLGGSTPDTTFRIDFFASAGYGPAARARPRTTWARWR